MEYTYWVRWRAIYTYCILYNLLLFDLKIDKPLRCSVVKITYYLSLQVLYLLNTSFSSAIFNNLLMYVTCNTSFYNPLTKMCGTYNYLLISESTFIFSTTIFIEFVPISSCTSTPLLISIVKLIDVRLNSH